jgi:hypothetical protein
VGRGHGVGAGSLAFLDGGTIYSVYLTRSISFKKVCGIISTSICYIIWYVLHVHLILVFLDLAPSCGHHRVKGYGCTELGWSGFLESLDIEVRIKALVCLRAKVYIVAYRKVGL